MTRRSNPALMAVVLMGALLASAAAAQLRLDRLEVTLWPEYDRPSVLVILHATLPADTALPAIVPLPMPTAAGAPHAVAKEGPTGNLLVAQYSVEAGGDWSTVKVLTDSPSVRLEYYAPLTMTDSQRRHRFYWPAGLAVGQIFYEVLHPVGATSMSVTPPADQVVEADGLTFYHADLGSRAGSEPFSITLAYAKETSTLSSPAAQAAPPTSAPQTSAAAESQPPSKVSTWMPLVLIGLAVAIGLALMFRRPGRRDAD